MCSYSMFGSFSCVQGAGTVRHAGLGFYGMGFGVNWLVKHGGVFGMPSCFKAQLRLWLACDSVVVQIVTGF